jgi:hypothetical protein
MSSITFHPDSVIWILGGLAVAVFFIARQFTAQPLNTRRLFLLPAVFAFLALRDLPSALTVSATAAAFLAAELALGAGLGVARGLTTRIWSRGGVVYTQGTVATLGAWIASIALRVAGGAIGHLAGVPFSTSEIFIFLAVTFGAQCLTIWARTSLTPAAVLVEA